MFGKSNGRKIFHDTKEMFDSANSLRKKSNHQFRHLMLCLKVVYNAINNYQSCQSLYEFVQLSLISTIKEPKRSLSNKFDFNK